MKIEKLKRYIFFSLCLFLFLVPLFGTNVYYNIFFLHVSIRFAVILIFLASLIPKENLKRMGTLEIAIIIFGLITLVSTIYSVERFRSMDFALNIIIGIIFLFLVTRLANNKKDLVFANKLFISSVTFVGLFYILKGYYEESDVLSIGWFTNPSAFSGFLITILPLTTLFYITSVRKTLWGSSVIIIGNAILFTGSRGATAIGILFFLFVILLFKKNHKETWIKQVLFIIALIIIVHMLLLMSGIKQIHLVQISVIDRGVASVVDSGTVRLPIWSNTLDIISKNLLLGTGAGTFPIIYNQYLAVGGGLPIHAHNLYLTLASEIGLIGLVSFLGIVIFAYKKGFFLLKNTATEDKWLIIFIILSISCFLLHNLFEHDLWIPPFQILFFLLLSNLLIIHNAILPSTLPSGGEGGDEGESPELDSGEVRGFKKYLGTRNKFAIIFGPIGILLLIYGVIFPLLGEVYFRESKRYAIMGEIGEAMKYNKKALIFLSNNPEYHRNLSILYDIAYDLTGNEIFMEKAISEATNAKNFSKNESHYYYILGILQWKGRLYEDAISSLKDAVRLSPARITYYYFLSDTLISLGRKNEALEILLKAKVLLENSNIIDLRTMEIYFRLASLYEKRDDQDEAKRYYNRIRVMKINEEGLSQSEKERYRTIKDIALARLLNF
ncbi:MAG: O-antigen ligase family protein [Nitrospirota bacterium]